MRIGILPNLHPFAGGIYQYSLAILRALCESKNHGYEDEFTIFADKLPPHLMSPNGVKWKLAPPEPSSLRQQALEGLARIVGEGPHREAWRWARRRLGQISRPPAPLRPPPDRVLFRHDMKRWLRQCGIELMLCAWPNRSSFEAEVPYVMAIHDLQHRLQPEFPEVSANGEWEMREYTFRNGCRYATLLLADSEVGKEDILNFYGCYGVTDDRVKVLPFLPATYLDGDISEVERQRVRSKYRLPDRFLFYPAQFWPHKNHGRIVQALGLLKRSFKTNVPIVFCGSHSGRIRENAFNQTMTLRSELNLENEIHYIGYVPDEEMAALYSGAVALIMPTFFGPTNIPVLEAWAFDCPVLTSDIRGIREQAGDAAVLVDPRSVEALADGIYRLWTDECLRRALTNAGHRRLSSYTAKDFADRLMAILEEAKERVTKIKTSRPGAAANQR
jgi:glycosyltransferase involved in cell wall biosynthesis